MKLTDMFAQRAGRMKASEIRELLKLLDRPGVISFAGGIPDPELFPAEAFREASARALGEGQYEKNLQYSASEGHAGLREWIAEHMRGLAVPATADDILITSGSQQALDYLGKLMLDAGDGALVGWPTYLGALGAFNAYEPEFQRLDVLRNTAPEQTGATKFAYVTPDFANPTGVTMTRAERLALLEQAEALGAAVIEDAAYQALRYAGEDVAPILALEAARNGGLEGCRTIYCGSFSKTLSPGLRVGWVCASRGVIDKLVLLKQAGDLHSATLNQALVADVAEREFATHVPKLRAAYGKRLAAMLTALERHMPEGVSWTKPEGGMFVWVTLPERANGAALLERALAEHNIAFVPGAAFFADGSGQNTIRLNFSMPSEIQIEEGISRLGKLLASL
ncbi:PLP-dependent aminotransferase family protein [Lentibacter algarum]|uniref:aminotransferase-like domain-containing protein n=1 Tax=Lentibacter algarum TaxID=576131 RepID=UPI001C073EEC|nr:PLP-dependent aminotransferase family protein [Lentibacter algarum]MBU2981526.1 PLP-dependent aminotransferase family protein [Lentibacter algarum]